MKLVLAVMACGDSDYHPDWAALEVNSTFISRIKRLRAICKKERLAGVIEACGPDEWGGGDEQTVQGDLLIVEKDLFYFRAHPRHADYEVETANVDIKAFLAAVSDPAGEIPDGWAVSEDCLYVTDDASGESIEYLIESFENSPADYV